MSASPFVVATADTCSGHPRVAGTRIRVSHVLGWLAVGMTPDEIAAEYPSITADAVRACLAYAAAQMDAAPVAAE